MLAPTFLGSRSGASGELPSTARAPDPPQRLRRAPSGGLSGGSGGGEHGTTTRLSSSSSHGPRRTAESHEGGAEEDAHDFRRCVRGGGERTELRDCDCRTPSVVRAVGILRTRVCGVEWSGVVLCGVEAEEEVEDCRAAGPVVWLSL